MNLSQMPKHKVPSEAVYLKIKEALGSYAATLCSYKKSLA
eukprot:CAMPEP_0170489276 /NCGR_PEP_ID=MMETSP0208-20121228/7648_1 /TAXON_ID=197538 /ORGANISM="Strombidium inclinatum, Strain S3" /LENGTH=39 /DNA_ID= /DNA_START= /DNA_END= /DNA_ORIENTATION=